MNTNRTTQKCVHLKQLTPTVGGNLQIRYSYIYMLGMVSVLKNDELNFLIVSAIMYTIILIVIQYLSHYHYQPSSINPL